MKKYLWLVLLLFMPSISMAEPLNIVVSLKDQRLYVQDQIWKISSGRKGYNTPRGEYKPYYLTPMHYSKKYDNAPMPNSVFFHSGYAIHATNAIGNLGKPASHGCIRLHPKNAKILFDLVKVNKAETRIIIQ